VGVRELHDQLSHYLRRVADGEEIFVTMRGRRVARLAPVADGDPLADLRARGLVQEPSTPWVPRAVGRPEPVQPVAELVADQRR
jgi:prevent-host-death family protein